MHELNLIRDAMYFTPALNQPDGLWTSGKITLPRYIDRKYARRAYRRWVRLIEFMRGEVF